MLDVEDIPPPRSRRFLLVPCEAKGWSPPTVAIIPDAADRARIERARAFMADDPDQIDSVWFTPASALTWDIQNTADEVYLVAYADGRVWLQVRPSFAPEDLFVTDVAACFG